MNSGDGISKFIKAVLFDLFDTLLLVERVDDLGERCIKNVYHFLARSGINVSFNAFMKAYSEVRKQIYERVDKYFEEPHFSVRILQTLMKLGYEYSNYIVTIAKGAAEAYMEELARHVYLDEEAIPVLQSLHESGYKTGVISNFSIPEGARKLIAEYGLKNFLDVIVISGEINRRKPCSEIFTTALNSLKVKSSEAVFVGDTPDTDIRGAKKVGIKTVLINRWNIDISSAEDKPNFIIRSLKEILDLLRK
ncbi:MAG: HAD family hydrolase [Candidatus Bathyarchaeia archaeon]